MTISGIAGVTVRGTDIDRVSDTQVTVELTFDRNINTDGTLTFTVGARAIADYTGSRTHRTNTGYRSSRISSRHNCGTVDRGNPG